jgi:flagellar motility protein MotE (MotC chaperone)
MAKPKKKLGLLIGLPIVLLLVAAGTAFGLAKTGIINIPGLSPKKKTKAIKVETKKKTRRAAKTPQENPIIASAAKVTINEQEGAMKLAESWNEIPTDKLLKVASQWSPGELAIVLKEMDPEKVASLLGAMPPKLSSIVSRSLKEVASKIPVKDE